MSKSSLASVGFIWDGPLTPPIPHLYLEDASPVSRASRPNYMIDPISNLPPTEVSGAAVSPSTAGEVTQLLARWDAKDPKDQAMLLKLVYPELKRLAEFRMRSERSNHTLQPTALVNELVVQMCSSPNQPWRDRVHFLAIASRAMRRILVDYARAHNSDKRGGQSCRIQMEGLNLRDPRDFCDILEIHDLLERLAREDKRMADVVELRYFGGLSNAEVGEMLGIGERTVKRDWQVARAWLFAHLHKGKDDAG
jgi:RNA polymerase sigma-70 factor (ECF subfamily)